MDEPVTLVHLSSNLFYLSLYVYFWPDAASQSLARGFGKVRKIFNAFSRYSSFFQPPKHSRTLHWTSVTWMRGIIAGKPTTRFIFPLVILDAFLLLFNTVDPRGFRYLHPHWFVPS